MQINEEQYLEHYGVLGMKWGHRRSFQENAIRTSRIGSNKTVKKVLDTNIAIRRTISTGIDRALTPKFIQNFVHEKWNKQVNDPKLQTKVWKQTVKRMGRIKPRMDKAFSKKFKDSKPSPEEARAHAAAVKKRFEAIATAKVHNFVGGYSYDGKRQIKVTVRDINKFPEFSIVKSPNWKEGDA